MRFGGDHPLYFSIHIPKTAGTRFRSILQDVYGSRLAIYYGPEDARTHPLLRVGRDGFVPAIRTRLLDAGIRVVHGHFTAEMIAPIVDDPAHVCAWLREPISRTISHYWFSKKMEDDADRRTSPNSPDLEDFLANWTVRNLQTRFLAGFAIEDYGFLGVSELMTEMLPSIGLAGRETTENANPTKQDMPLETRLRILPAVMRDIALYSWSLDRSLALLGRRAGTGRRPFASRLYRGARRALTDLLPQA